MIAVQVKSSEKGTHTQMAHDPNRFMKGFAFVRESWRGCMRCSPWLAKEMSTDSPIVKTGARKIAGRTWGPVRRFLTRALFSLPCCLRSADVTLRGISHRSAATTLITLDLDGWFSSGGCSKSCVESQMQDANPFESIRIHSNHSNHSTCHEISRDFMRCQAWWVRVPSSEAWCDRFPGARDLWESFEYFPYLSISFYHFPFCGFQVRGECPLDAGHALFPRRYADVVCLRSAQVNRKITVSCHAGLCFSPLDMFKPHVWCYTKSIYIVESHQRCISKSRVARSTIYINFFDRIMITFFVGYLLCY